MIRYLPMLPLMLMATFLATATTPEALPPGKGKEIVQQQCISCHAVKVVTGKRATKDQWATLVDQMITRGAQVEDEDIDDLVDYLAKNFGPSAPAPGSAANKDTASKDKEKDQGASHLLHINS